MEEITLKEAIERLTLLIPWIDIRGCYHEPEALKLGIEALKRIKLHREVHYKDAIFWLPGETEEGK